MKFTRVDVKEIEGKKGNRGKRGEEEVEKYFQVSTRA